MARVALVKKEEPVRSVQFLHTGSTLLNLQNGGGWALGRVINIVGDKSAGKTLLAIEACINFKRKYGAKNIRYNETEAAFDRDYANSLGLDGISFVGDEAAEEKDRHGSRTVEELYEDITGWLKDREGPCLYVVDSLDALSDAAEMERKMGEATYGTGKAKSLSEFFRREIRNIEGHDCLFVVISQIRDKIGVTFGETKTRSGGRALDFYASQIVWLSEIQKLKRTVKGVDRVVGVETLAYNKKNKVGMPFRKVEISVFFNYGVDDELSMIEWLKENKIEKLGDLTLKDIKSEITKARENRDRDALNVIADELRQAVTKRWNDIEDALRPPLGKYE